MSRGRSKGPSDTRTYKVVCKIPIGVTDREVKDFIKDSLGWAGGCRSPDDPLFSSLKVSSVTSIRSLGSKND